MMNEPFIGSDVREIVTPMFIAYAELLADKLVGGLIWTSCCSNGRIPKPSAG
ncbi:hypothetical protein [Paenibacillus guangzhouensis]|uniref:hypothetical protein n=1 Tax=Paenibacillus guangzhouensis TaxID=1473112 RepID=UPI00187B381A|nr:hypothetical protein [Paenibacillus guangzhouensis]